MATMDPPCEYPPTSLLDLLSNEVVLGHLAPYIGIRSTLNLCATNSTYNALIKHSTETFRHVDLSGCLSRGIVPDMTVDRGGIKWRSQRMDEALTEDDIFGGPIRGMLRKLSRPGALARVQTLILDGLTVPADVVSEILADTNVRILSIRECRNLNETKLCQALKYAVRPTRPEGTPKLRALYVFGPRNGYLAKDKSLLSSNSDPCGVTLSQGAQIGAEWNIRSHDALNSSFSGCEDSWYRPSGKLFQRSVDVLKTWGETLKACEGVIAFDAPLCRGPRHDAAYIQQTHGQDAPKDEFLPPIVATITIGQYGCATCKSSHEGPAIFGQSPASHLPLLHPPPLHSTTVEDAQRPAMLPGSKYPPLYARCLECMKGRWCERCLKWWDERCYSTGTRTSESGVQRDCWGCGFTCYDCNEQVIRDCKACRAEFCVECNEGSTSIYCDWCASGGRRTRELY